MLLENKNAIIYGGGSIGGAVARAFSREGARVFLAGRTRGALEMVANGIKADGGAAEVAVLDAFDEQAVDEQAKAVVSHAGSIDVSFNLITRGDVQGMSLIDMATDDFCVPWLTAYAPTSSRHGWRRVAWLSRDQG
jgi:3-oxoacyl-[acyl-carrier protein] reductase